MRKVLIPSNVQAVANILGQRRRSIRILRCWEENRVLVLSLSQEASRIELDRVVSWWLLRLYLVSHSIL